MGACTPGSSSTATQARRGSAQRIEALTLDGRQQYLGSAVRNTRRPLMIGSVTPGHLDAIAQSAEHRQMLRELEPKSFLALPLLAHGGVVGSLLFISTSQEHHYAEEDLAFTEQVAMRAALSIEKARLYRIAQEAIKLRDDVLNVVAHDLRNPLGTILLQAGLLRRRQAEGERRTTKPAEMIERAATRMNHLIQDLLDVARMEGGRLTIERSPLPVEQVIADAVQTQEPLAASASLELRLDLESDLPELWADRDRLLRVFENLIGNAIKFTEGGGSITVGAARTRRRGSVLGRRHGHRIGGRRAAARVRAAVAGARRRPSRRRARSADREGPRRSPRRPRLGREHARRRQHLLLHDSDHARRGELASGPAPSPSH